MENNINKLVKDFKETGKKEIMNEIYKILNPILESKGRYIFNRKVYKKNNKYINLKETNMIAEDDIFQELWVLVMEIIENYIPEKPFMNYFYSTLWHFRPSFIDQNFLFQNNIVLESSLVTEENLNPLDNMIKTEPNQEPEFEELNDRENEIVKIIFCDSSIKQGELAKKMKISQQSISNIMIEIRKKIKNYK